MKGMQTESSAASPALGSRTGSVLLVTSLAAFLTPFMGSSINIALPAIGAEYSAGTLSLNWISSAFLLAAAVFLVPFGRVGDISGRRRVFLLGLALFTASQLAAVFSPVLGALIALRALQGMGAGMIFGSATAILGSAYPPGKRGRALGINVAATYAGLSVGPFLGGVLTGAFGWRSLFITGSALSAVAFLIALVRLRSEWADARGERLDVTGSLIFAVSLVALMYGLSLVPSISGAALVTVGLAGLSVFVLWELRAAAPVLDMGLFKGNAVFAFSNLAALINYSATFSVSFLLSLYLQYAKGFSPEQAGIVLVAQPVVQAALSPLTGRLSDRVPPRLPASLGMLLTAAGLACLSLLGSASRIEFLIAALAVVGLGFALFSSPNTNAVMGAVERRHYGVASSVLATMRLVGQMLSMGVAMAAFSLCGANARLPAGAGGGDSSALVKAVRAAFIVGAALCGAGVLASLARGKGESGARVKEVPGEPGPD
jgi:EmrB/QacA subfamily drug resistance transporter